MTINRRHLLQVAGGAAATLAAPRIARSQGKNVLRFVPYVDLAILDPVVNTAAQTRTHGYMVFDTLYAQDAEYRAQPEMVAGHQIDDDHKLWTLTLRDGLLFHDNTPVLARDVVASLKRWGAADPAGRALFAVVAEIAAPSDKVVTIRMQRPYRLLPDVLGKIAPSMACIMPERLADTSPSKAITEVVGSGPFRFVANERVPGSRAVYERFAGYVPRPRRRSAGSDHRAQDRQCRPCRVDHHAGGRHGSHRTADRRDRLVGGAIARLASAAAPGPQVDDSGEGHDRRVADPAVQRTAKAVR